MPDPYISPFDEDANFDIEATPPRFSEHLPETWPVGSMNWAAGQLVQPEPNPIDPMGAHDITDPMPSSQTDPAFRDWLLRNGKLPIYEGMTIQDAVDIFSGKYAPENPVPAPSFTDETQKNFAFGFGMIGDGFKRYNGSAGRSLADGLLGAGQMALGAASVIGAIPDAALTKFVGYPVYNRTGIPPDLTGLALTAPTARGGAHTFAKMFRGGARTMRVAVEKTVTKVAWPDELSIVFKPGQFDEFEKAYEVIDNEGTAHYSITIGSNDGKTWRVDRVLNETQEYQNLAPALYQDMAQRVEMMNGKFFAGLSTNQRSERLHQDLVRMGLAKQVPGEDLGDLGELGRAFRHNRDVAIWEILPYARDESDLAYLLSVWQATKAYNRRQRSRLWGERLAGAPPDARYYVGPRQTMFGKDYIEAWHRAKPDLDSLDDAAMDGLVGNGAYLSSSPRAADKFRKLDASDTDRIYKVRIVDSKPDQFLDWNKRLSRQSPYVKSRLRELGLYERGKSVRELLADLQAHPNLKAQLLRNGVRGIRYQKQTMKEGTTLAEIGPLNYSVWDSKRYLRMVPEDEWTFRDYLKFYMPSRAQVKIGTVVAAGVGAPVFDEALDRWQLESDEEIDQDIIPQDDLPIFLGDRDAARVLSGED